MPPFYAVHGENHDILEFIVVFNHKIGDVKAFGEDLVVRGHFTDYQAVATMGWGTVVTYPNTDDVVVVGLDKVKDSGGVPYLLCKGTWKSKYTALEIGYRPKGKAEGFVTITGRITSEFEKVFASTVQEAAKPPKGQVIFPHFHSGPGKWAVSHNFLSKSNLPAVCLWRKEIPAHFEMHSHVMSNHCAPVVGIWEKSGATLFLEPSYGTQDYMADFWFVMGEAGDIGKRSTTAIAAEFAKQMGAANFQKVFPYLKEAHTASGTLMPMDMEYMHFLGYFGIPITRWAYGKKWYCWNKKWEKHTNNTPTVIASPSMYGYVPPTIIPPETETPASTHGETWSFLSKDDAKAYVPWAAQLADHERVTKSSLSVPRVSSLPFYHFEPRRHANLAQYPAEKTLLALSMTKAVQSSVWSRASLLFGYKLYTAMGWAPMDPYLKDVLQPFYMQCEADQIPILNHCTPVGFYSHDRRFYFDLLKEQGLVSATPARHGDGWPKQFPSTVPGPDGKILAPSTKEDKIWWYTQNYVSPDAWKAVAKAYPKLKFCLAHFGDSAHLDEDGWGERKVREPKGTRKKLTIAFSGAQIDRANSHWFLADLIDLVQPTNRAFIDLSYVMLNKRNSVKFQELFDWARIHKPILLERVLWGTDWPLLGNESMVKDYKWTKENILHRYARAFRDQISSMPGDFFLRVCFLNPIQYLGLHSLPTKVGQAGVANPWPWLSELPEAIFTDFTADKLRLLYKHEKSLAHALP